MLKTIKISRFKSIEEATLNFGRLNFFIGTNASGKSNFFDALRVLQAIGYGFTISEIFQGKAKAGGSIEWEGIRGGSEGAVFRPKTGKKGKPKEKHAKTTFAFDAKYQQNGMICDYLIQINPFKGIVLKERFAYANANTNQECVLFETIEGKTPERLLTAKVYSEGKGRKPHYDFTPTRSILHQVIEDADSELSIEHIKAIKTFIELLSDVQKLDLEPRVLREYSKQLRAERIGERGENFAALVKTILSDKTKKQAYIEWLKKLTPTELDDVKNGKGAVGEPIFGIVEGKNVNYAPMLSDGTLRFAALTAALFQASSPHIMLLEEVDNGIHATRLRLLVELLIQRTKKETAPQLFVTTHSPVLLSWLPDSVHDFVFHCMRNDNGASFIRPIKETQRFVDIIKKQPLGELFAEGWLENSL